MLYQVYETQRTLMEPFVDFAQAASKLYGNPQSPLGQNPLIQRIAAGYSLIYRLGKDYEKPAFEIQTVDVDGTSVAIHERVEIDKPFCELRRFKRFTDDPATLTKLKGQPAVLIVAPLSGHYATLLRDTVKTMLKDHKVYITDWKNARTVPLADGAFHLDDYVNYVQEFIRHLQKTYGNCHVISVCQPTVPVFAAISLMATRGETTPLSMTMMGGPIDARLAPTAVNNLAMNKSFEWFENNVIYKVPSNFAGAGRRVYPGFLQHTGFVAMNPNRHATSHFDYFKDLIKGDDASVEAHRKFYDEYNAVLDMDADYYLETIKIVFQEFRLVNGSWDVMSVNGKAERVKPADIKTTAVMTVEGELDDISGSGQTRAALAMCTGVAAGHKKHLEVEGAGHYGIFSGRRWREKVYPSLKAFILQAHITQTAPVIEVAAIKSKATTKPIKGTVKPAARTLAQTPSKSAVQIAAKPVKPAEAKSAEVAMAMDPKTASSAKALKAIEGIKAVKAVKAVKVTEAAKPVQAVTAPKAAVVSKITPPVASAAIEDKAVKSVVPVRQVIAARPATVPAAAPVPVETPAVAAPGITKTAASTTGE